MANHKVHTKREPREFGFCRQCDDKRRSQLSGERNILELISLGAPLPVILNKLCTAIDVQIGDVVSLVLLPGVGESHVSSIAQSATQFGLNVFSSTSILSRDKNPMGTLQIYCCDQRNPTAHEFQLIERVVHLAAIAFQHHEDEENFERPSRRSGSGIDNAVERPPLIN
jgi:hypothetical protein